MYTLVYPATRSEKNRKLKDILVEVVHNHIVIANEPRFKDLLGEIPELAIDLVVKSATVYIEPPHKGDVVVGVSALDYGKKSKKLKKVGTFAPPPMPMPEEAPPEIDFFES